MYAWENRQYNNNHRHRDARNAYEASMSGVKDENPNYLNGPSIIKGSDLPLDKYLELKNKGLIKEFDL